MSGFIKSIRNFLGGILSFFVGLFGGKKAQENKPSLASSAEKLADTTASSAEKLADAATKTSSKILSSVGGEKSQENKPSTKTAEKPAAATAKKRKRSGYFMELDEAEDTKSANGNKPAQGEAAKTPQPVAAKTPQPVAAAQPAKAEPAKTPQPAANAQAAAAKIELVQTAEGVKAEPAKREKSPVASTNGQNQTETTFAPKYLAPNPASNSRRRPGPSMNNFLDMARQVKTPG